MSRYVKITENYNDEKAFHFTEAKKSRADKIYPIGV